MFDLDFTCANGNGPIKASYVCDGDDDCGDCSDETCEHYRNQCKTTQGGTDFVNLGRIY